MPATRLTSDLWNVYLYLTMCLAEKIQEKKSGQS